MSGFLDKVSDFFFKGEEGAERETRETVVEPAAPIADSRSEKRFGRKAGSLVSVPSKKGGENLEIVLFKAKNYEDMQEIARSIRDRKVAVVNFEDMDKLTAQRMVDFLSGAAFALGGTPRKVSGGTFIFSSAQVDMSGQIMDKDAGSIDAEDFSADSRFSTSQWMR